MAPEVLSSKQLPASDIWSAGVMAYQLLSGYLPFNDHRNPDSPALSVIWYGICSPPWDCADYLVTCRVSAACLHEMAIGPCAAAEPACN